MQKTLLLFLALALVTLGLLLGTKEPFPPENTPESESMLADYGTGLKSGPTAVAEEPPLRTPIEEVRWFVRGRLVGAEGLPLRGCRIVLRMEGLEASITTGADGRFSLGFDGSRSSVRFEIEPPGGAGSQETMSIDAFRFGSGQGPDLGDIRVSSPRR